jgi:hypothetical protein
MIVRGRCPHCGTKIQTRVRDVFAGSWDRLWAAVDRLFDRLGGMGL